MENRFGFKELVLSILLVAILVSIWLAMVMFDRQHETIGHIKQQMTQQTSAQARMERSIIELQQAVERGAIIRASAQELTPAESPSSKDPFVRMRKAKQRDDYAEGDWLIDAFPVNVARITPLITKDAYGTTIHNRVLEPLCVRDPDTLEWAPLLARSWKIEDHSEAYTAYLKQAQQAGMSKEQIAADPNRPPALVITFQLRRGITFSDGEPLTAQDVKFAFDLLMNEAIDAPTLRHMLADKLESVRATDTHEVLFRFREPFFNSFAQVASFQALAKHFYGSFTPDEFNKKPGLLLGSGPYRMERPSNWVPGKPLILVKNERYWGQSPAYDRLIYREINHDLARLTALRNGEIDIFGRALPEQFLQMARDEQIRSQTQQFEVSRPTEGYGYIAWNQMKRGKPTHFADRRVRQAMTMLTNRQRLINEVLHGYGKITTGPFNPLSKQYNHDIKPWPFEPSRGRELLAEAGFCDRDGDGVIESAQGEPFIYKHTYPSAGTFWTGVLLMFKDDYAKAGIVMKLDPLEWSVFAERIKSRDFDAISMAWGGGIENDIHQMFHSANVAQGADNFVSYVNPRLDVLIDQARSTVQEPERMPLWQQCHAILHEDQPYTFLYIRKHLTVMDRRIHNVQRVRIGLNDLTEWYTPLRLQRY